MHIESLYRLRSICIRTTSNSPIEMIIVPHVLGLEPSVLSMRRATLAAAGIDLYAELPDTIRCSLMLAGQPSEAEVAERTELVALKEVSKLEKTDVYGTSLDRIAKFLSPARSDTLQLGGGNVIHGCPHYTLAVPIDEDAYQQLLGMTSGPFSPTYFALSFSAA